MYGKWKYSSTEAKSTLWMHMSLEKISFEGYIHNIVTLNESLDQILSHQEETHRDAEVSALIAWLASNTMERMCHMPGIPLGGYKFSEFEGSNSGIHRMRKSHDWSSRTYLMRYIADIQSQLKSLLQMIDIQTCFEIWWKDSELLTDGWANKMNIVYSKTQLKNSFWYICNVYIWKHVWKVHLQNIALFV